MHDYAIIGGGIVGLSVAFQLLESDPSLRICVLEKECSVAQHQSSHNSGVIHSGVYYKPGSLKALNCKAGYKALLHFCQKEGIEYEVCGKLIVATDENERSKLRSIYQNGLKNGLKNLEILNGDKAREIEPHIQCTEAIKVPQSGIINFGLVAETYATRFVGLGGKIIINFEVRQLLEKSDHVQISNLDKSIIARRFISCAGLYSDKISRLTLPDNNHQILPFRGEYFKLIKEKEHLVNHLIYPVPNPDFPFLGVHFTRMINGGIEAGPNAVLAFRREGYHRSQVNWAELRETLSFSGFRKLAGKYWQTGLQEIRRSYSKEYFVQALQKLIPEITANDVIRGRSGVRAMACDGAGNLVDDFSILSSSRGLHVVNAPSPAATASLAIGQEIIGRL